VGVFVMPSLGSDMEDGVLVEWLAKLGDRVARGDVIAVVETQKGAIEIEVFEDGVIERLEAKIGDRLSVGAPLAAIAGEKSAARPEAPPIATRAEATATTPQPAPAVPAAAAAPASTVAGPRPASPAARIRATELGVDLASIVGSGPDGAVVLADVEAATAAPREAGGARGLDLAAMRAAIAAAMARSKREIPHYYLSQTIDLQPASDWLAARNAERPPERRLLMGALFVRATALALAAAPALNGRWEDDAFRPSQAAHVGVAVAMRGGGLIAPAIRDAHSRPLDDVMSAMRDLVARVRAGRLRSSEMTDGTITVSSMGERGADALTGVIYPPQVALVGFGTPARRPWVRDGAVVARTVVVATLAADHRVSDGRLGARFLSELDRLLQTPEAL
jgi:pyruvate dehydrogenase E2 component (dihydrolipoamide acetyltransferase)